MMGFLYNIPPRLASSMSKQLGGQQVIPSGSTGISTMCGIAVAVISVSERLPLLQFCLEACVAWLGRREGGVGCP